MKSNIFIFIICIVLCSCHKTEQSCDQNKIVTCIHTRFTYQYCDHGQFINVQAISDTTQRNECDGLDLVDDVQRLHQQTLDLAKQNQDTIGVLWLTQYPPECGCK